MQSLELFLKDFYESKFCLSDENKPVHLVSK